MRAFLASRPREGLRRKAAAPGFPAYDSPVTYVRESFVIMKQPPLRLKRVPRVGFEPTLHGV